MIDRRKVEKLFYDKILKKQYGVKASLKLAHDIFDTDMGERLSSGDLVYLMMLVSLSAMPGGTLAEDIEAEQNRTLGSMYQLVLVRKDTGNRYYRYNSAMGDIEKDHVLLDKNNKANKRFYDEFGNLKPNWWCVARYHMRRRL